MSEEKYTRKNHTLSIALILVQIIAFLVMFLLATFFFVNIIKNNEKILEEMAMSVVEDDLKDEVTNTIKQIDQMYKNTVLDAKRIVDVLSVCTEETISHTKEELQNHIQKANESFRIPMFEAVLIQNETKWLITSDEIKMLTDLQYTEWIEKTEYLTETISANGTIFFASIKEGIQHHTIGQVRTMIHNQVHYDSNKYTWVNEIINMEGGDNYAVRRIHPNLKDTEGMLLSTSMQDITGALPYLEELEGIRENGEILYTYYFKNLLNDEIELKVTYACYYEPFRWIVAMGEPISDISARTDNITSYSTKQILQLGIVFLGTGILLLFFDIFLLNTISANMLNALEEKENTRRLELETALNKAKEANMAKSTFLFNMSHDIRTPMNAVIGFIRIAKNHIDNKERAVDALEKADVSSHHMLSVINDVLDMARIESGKLDIKAKQVFPAKQLEKIQEIYSQSMKDKGIHFITEAENLPNVILVDDTKVMQVIGNLISNSLKFTPAGGTIWLKIKQTADEQEKHCFEVLVKDTGIGMSEEFQKKAFAAFEREKNATVSRLQGTGLGLSIAKKMAEALDGDLTFTSVPDKGSEFIFTFKAEPVKLENEADNLSNTNKLDFTGKRLLLVEDIELNREIAMEILTSEGFIVEEAENGKEAVDKVIQSEPGYYDAILMDIQMPVMNGYDAAREIRALDNPYLSGIPIIAMTANAFDEDRKNAFEAGMNDHVAKPVETAVLLEALNNVIRD